MQNPSSLNKDCCQVSIAVEKLTITLLLGHSFYGVSLEEQPVCTIRLQLFRVVVDSGRGRMNRFCWKKPSSKTPTVSANNDQLDNIGVVQPARFQRIAQVIAEGHSESAEN